MVWKVVYVNSRSEKKAATLLSGKGITCYVPLKKEMKQWSDRKKLTESPLINGYVFVRPATPRQRDEILEQKGIISYLRYNGSDAIVRDEEIEILKMIESKGYFVEGGFAPPNVGELATIGFGPFKGMRGTVTSFHRDDVYNVMIESIGYSLTLRVPKDLLIKAAP